LNQNIAGRQNIVLIHCRNNDQIRENVRILTAAITRPLFGTFNKTTVMPQASLVPMEQRG